MIDQIDWTAHLQGTSRNRSERFECKAHGAQEPQCTWLYMRIPGTAKRRNRTAQ